MAVKSGYKQTEVGVIPSSWKVRPFGDLASTVASGRSKVEATFGEYPVYGSTGVIGYCKEPEYEGDAILVARVGANAGKLNQVKGKYGVTDNTIILRVGSDSSLPFLYRQLESKRLNSLVFGSGQPLITGSQLKALVICEPPLAEQRAIAAALSDVDALLEGLERLIAKKRDLKQASMQKLLTGQTRLPGFQGEWELVQVQDVIEDFFCGPSPTCEERNIQDEFEWGVLKTTAATKESGWDWTKHKTLPRVFWNKPQLELKQGDVIVTKAGPRHRVGVTAWVSYVPPRIIVSGKMIGLRPSPDKVVPLMLASAISARDSQAYLDQRTTGMAESQVNFENSALLVTPIRIPSFDEQVAIAAVLSDMDTELAALEQRLAKTRALKQGMMQELLTGRTRLV